MHIFQKMKDCNDCNDDISRVKEVIPLVNA